MITFLFLTLWISIQSLAPQYQIDALVDIYYSLHGDSWTDECRWNITKIKNGDLSDDECSILLIDTVDGWEVVKGISFGPYDNASGDLPSSINNLTTLITFTLMRSGISGTLDESIGNLADLQDLILVDTALTGTIPLTICNLTELFYIDLVSTNITGSIPECIFINNKDLYYVKLMMTHFPLPSSIIYAENLRSLAIGIEKDMMSTIPTIIGNLTQLTELQLSGYFNGTIPEWICDLNINLDFLHFSYLPVLSGTIPQCIFELPELESFQLINTSIEGSIPSSLCNTANNSGYGLGMLHITNNYYLNSSIPSCDDYNFDNIMSINIASNPGLIGTISHSFLCPSNPGFFGTHIAITNNTNMDENTIPECWEHLSNLHAINIENNNFIGTFPTLNSTEMQLLLLADNKLEGTISNFLPSSQYSKEQLYYLTLHNNKFIENDVSSLLHTLVTNYSKLNIITLYGNDGIKGSLPDFDTLFVNNHTTHLLLHGCNIYGTIPSNLEFSSLQYLTLFDNRLSCSISETFAPSNCTSLVISSNLFECDGNEFPKWVDSDFSSAPNLFVTSSSNTTGFIWMIIAFLCFMIHIIIKIKRNKDKINQHYLHIINKETFIEDIELFQSKFDDWKLLLLLMLVLILYPISSTYFECTPIITWFTLSWFYNDDINSADYWLLFVIIIFMNLIFCHIVSTLYVIQLQSQIGDKTMCLDNESLLKDSTKHQDEDNLSIPIEYNVKMERNKYVEFLLFVIYCLLYIFGAIMIVLYAFCESLPDDNTLLNSSITRNFITKAMSLILTIDNVFIVPKLCDAAKLFLSSSIIKSRKTELVLLLRTFNTLIIPIIASVFLLNDCGKMWTQYWTPCSDENRNSAFNVEFNVVLGAELDLQLLSPNDVCSPQSITEINWNKCIRSFFYRWTYVIILKFIIMIFMPYIIIITKILKSKLIKLYNEYKGKIYKKAPEIEIDSEYSMIITSFESVITFSIISPLLIPIVLVAIDSTMLSYHIMLNKLNWKLTTYKNISSSFPVHLLIIGISFEQLLTSLFIIFVVGNEVMFYLYVFVLCVIDFCYLFVSCKTRYDLID